VNFIVKTQLTNVAPGPIIQLEGRGLETHALDNGLRFRNLHNGLRFRGARFGLRFRDKFRAI